MALNFRAIPALPQQPAARPLLAGMPSVFFMLLAGLTFMSAGCEDKAIGRVCEVQADADGGVASGSVSTTALECPSRMCIRPNTTNSAKTVDTTSLCSADCSKDSDCDGESRTSAVGDLRCKSGFICAVPRVLGPLCCRKLCMCKDFENSTNIGSGVEIPSVCRAGAPGKTCAASL